LEHFHHILPYDKNESIVIANGHSSCKKIILLVVSILRVETPIYNLQIS